MSAIRKQRSDNSAFRNLPEKLLIKNIRLFDPAEKLDKVYDLLIENGKINIGQGAKEKLPPENIIDGSGLLALPGLFDMHVHLREPGREDKETIVTGGLAAANGGFTGVACMPNTSPSIDTQETVQFILEEARKTMVDVFPVAAITKSRRGEELAPIAELVEAGAIAISDDGSPVMNAEIMRRALEYSKMFDIPVLGHEEDINLAKSGHMHEGFYSTKLGIPGIPGISEDIMVARDIMLTDYTGGRFHVCHISTKQSIELIRRAKEKGLKVTCEVTPHHFTLTDKEVESFDTSTKMNPPLRSEEDVQAAIDGIKDGTIDVIATDHAPHTIEEKEAEYIYAPFGITGLETSVGLVFSTLANSKQISLERVYDLMIANPRKILNIEVPRIRQGAEANLSIIDPEKKWKYSEFKSFSKSQNTPFKDTALVGKSMLTINKGRIFYSE